MPSSLPYDIVISNHSARKAYTDMLNRLNDDVRPAIDYYKKTGHGNWSSIRMIAPVIEAIAKNNSAKRNSLLKHIGIQYPRVFWVMYRHGLSHNDMMPASIQLARDEIGVGWGFDWNQAEAAKMVNTNYCLNPSVIFENLLSWLRMELINNSGLDSLEIKQSVSVIMKSDTNSAIKVELTEMLALR